MIGYILHRIAVMIPTLVIISALVFTIIELPPGDYFETYVAQLQAQGESVDLRQIEFLRQQYGFDRPPVERYFVWVWGMLHGDFGYSFAYELPVRDVVGDRIWLTILVSFVTIIFTWVIAFPIGIYSATHQYSWGDHGLTFLGLHRPGDAQLPAGAGVHVFRQPVVRHLDRRPHGPAVHQRADELGQVHVDPGAPVDPGDHHRHVRHRRHDPPAARQPARRAAEAVRGHRQGQGAAADTKALLKYPLRMSLNFFISDIGSILPAIISGAEITAIVLSLQTTGPLLISALRARTCISPAPS
jgi:peptide/nickel transport system permease protein